jgi:hypothetical protein
VLNAMEQALPSSSSSSDVTNTTSDRVSSAVTVAAAAAPQKTGLMLPTLERLKAMKYPSGGLSQNSAFSGRTRDSLRQEFRSYVTEETINSSDDPLKWWRENRLRFPNVALVDFWAYLRHRSQVRGHFQRQATSLPKSTTVWDQPKLRWSCS